MKKKYFFILPAVVAFVSFARLANSTEESDLMSQNIEALTLSGEQWGYEEFSGKCPHPLEYKKWRYCGKFIPGGNPYCQNSDC